MAKAKEEKKEPKPEEEKKKEEAKSKEDENKQSSEKTKEALPSSIDEKTLMGPSPYPVTGYPDDTNMWEFLIQLQHPVISSRQRI